MDRDEILAMEPGRELDSLISEKIMGYITHGHFREKNGVRILVQPYSTDISAAFEVVEKMRPTHVYEMADFGRNMHKDNPHYAAFHPINKPRDYKRQVHAKTLTEAICKAALLAALEVTE